MKRSKRIDTILLAVTVVWTTVLAGCASGESEVTSGGNGTTVTFWHGSTDVEQEALEEIVKAFNEQQSDVTVEAVYIAQQGEGQNEKLLAAIAGGNPPDVAYFDRFEVGSWAAQGSLTDLTEYADQDNIEDNDYYEYAINEAKYEGKLYGLPMDTDARLLFYNKDHFKEAGLDPENPPKKIAELEEVAEKLILRKGTALSGSALSRGMARDGCTRGDGCLAVNFTMKIPAK